MAKNFSKLERHLDIQVQEAHRTQTIQLKEILYKTYCIKTAKNQRQRGNLEGVQRKEACPLEENPHKAMSGLLERKKPWFLATRPGGNKEWNNIFKVPLSTKKTGNQE